MTWAQRNPDKIKGYNQKYRAKNPEYFREYMRDYMNRRPWYRAMSALKCLKEHPERSLFSVFSHLRWEEGNRDNGVPFEAVDNRTPFDILCDKEELTLQNCNIG